MLFLLCFMFAFLLGQSFRILQIYIEVMVSTIVTYNIFLVNFFVIFSALTMGIYCVYSDLIDGYRSLELSYITTATFLLRNYELTDQMYARLPNVAFIFQYMMIFFFVFIVSNIFITLVM